ncbi:hypothetical protein DPMN_188118 [Dreissena polymorpha]|uniref:Uncharacterized protein n=1 Tax=Dreissena polymorpha TaxID=45954 RepID=A0A9D4DRH4_DREPO|nr:hypothetical protein DPMN_188118 [Dreissena polymorpha]
MSTSQHSKTVSVLTPPPPSATISGNGNDHRNQSEPQCRPNAEHPHVPTVIETVVDPSPAAAPDSFAPSITVYFAVVV